MVSACPCADLPNELAPSFDVSLSASASFGSWSLRKPATHCTSRYLPKEVGRRVYKHMGGDAASQACTPAGCPCGEGAVPN
eukprot:4195341-Prymnesium_polylepis.3